MKFSSVLTLIALPVLGVFAQTNDTIIVPDAPLRFENVSLCRFTLQTSDGINIYRTDEYELARANGNASLFPAHFWVTESRFGRLYGGNGKRCDFDPYLRCDSNARADKNDNSNHPFDINTNGTLSFSSQSVFHLCSRGAFWAFNDGLHDYSFIYPPLNTGDQDDRRRNYQNCTAVQLVANRCFQNAEYTVAASSAVSNPTTALTVTTTSPTTAVTTTGSLTTSRSTTTSGSPLPIATGNTGTTIGAANSFDVMLVGGMVGTLAMAFAWL